MCPRLVFSVVAGPLKKIKNMGLTRVVKNIISESENNRDTEMGDTENRS